MNFKEKIIESGLWKSLLYLFVITLIFGIVMLMNFTTGELFDFSQLKNGEYWAAYAVTVGLSLMILLLGAVQKKDRLTRAPKIRDVQDELLALDRAIIENKLYDDFSNDLSARNAERKKAKYKRILIKARARAKTDSEAKKYSARIDEMEAPDFDIEKYEVRGYRSININTVLSDVEAEDDGDNLIYTGWEKLAQWVLPQVLIGMLLTGVMLTLRTPDIKEMSLDACIQLAMRLYMMSSYLLAGMQYGEYSVNTVYFRVLINRKDEILRFFGKKGMRVEMTDNDSYKYKAKLTEVPNGDK